MKLPDDMPDTKFIADLATAILTVALALAMLLIAGGWIEVLER